MTDKQKRIIAYIIAIWFAIFGSIGMVQTGLNIANCAGQKKQVKQAYAADSAVIESTKFRFNLGNIYRITTTTKANTATKKNNEKTWLINETPDGSIETPFTDLNYTSNNETFHGMGIFTNSIYYNYDSIGGEQIKVYSKTTGWVNETYRTIEFTTAPTDEELINWLNNNATHPTEPTPPTPTERTIIEQSTQQIEFIFTTNSITIQIYNANRETTYIGKWIGSQENGWDSEIGSYNTKPIDGTTTLQREGFSIHLSPQNTSILTGQIQPTYIPTQGEKTIYQNQIQFKFGLASTTEESEYIQIQVNKTSEQTINFIPENTIFQSSLNTTGYTQGYQDGYKQGQQEKEIYGITQYNKGKQDGIANANNYSFKSLISAVFDVPVQTLYGMLNFNILGINILSFVMSIISVILLIAIVKVFL